jgi:hypothetical protein
MLLHSPLIDIKVIYPTPPVCSMLRWPRRRLRSYCARFELIPKGQTCFRARQISSAGHRFAQSAPTPL